MSWQVLSKSVQQAMPETLQPWLTQPYILTQHLKAAGQWSLGVLQAWTKQESDLWRRQVMHQLDGQAAVYAEVNVPDVTYQRFVEEFGDLDRQPLGETLLYHNDAVTRGPFEYVHLDEDECSGDLGALKQRALSAFGLKQKGLWARRSTFYWHELPLEVVEVFIDVLPPFVAIASWRQGLSAARNHLLDYAYLIRLHRPIPILLMLWPTLWALWIAAKGVPPWPIVVIFIVGVVVMRSAGDILNDLTDRRFDGYIERTKKRPLATGRVSVRSAFVLVGLLCCVALALVLMLNWLCLWLSFVGLALAVVYPWMKRVTHWPQAVLGLAYNWGVIMAFAAVQNHVPLIAWYVFALTVAWTIAYDSMYALADREDDKTVGLKSTAVFFGDYYHQWIAAFQLIFWLGLWGLGLWLQASWFYYTVVVICLPLLVYQHFLLPGREIQRCIRAFNHNHWIGLIIFIAITSV